MAEPKVKERVLDAVRELPDDGTVEDAMERLYFLAKVEKGLQEADAVQDLQSIREFIERDSPRYGRLVAERVYDATSRLERFPCRAAWSLSSGDRRSASSS